MFVNMKNNKRVYGLDTEQEQLLKDHLTHDNPAYKNAKRFSKNRYITIPPYLYYFTSGKDSMGKYLEVPIGVDVEKVCNHKINPQKHKGDGCCVGGNSHQVKYPEFKLELRPTQKEAVTSYLTAAHHYGSGLLYFPPSIVSLPTGKGKTILALNLAAQVGEKALILVHKDDLVSGWQKDIDLCFGGAVKTGLVKAKSRVVGEHITIATVQTLHRMSPEELSQYTDQFGLVVQDEVHHCALSMFNIVDKFNSRYKLGLSATPKRSDGLDFVFDLFFGGICYEYKAGKDDEDISNVVVRVLDSGFKYRPFEYNGEVFNYYDFKPEDIPKRAVFHDQIKYTDRQTIPFHTIDNQAVTASPTRVAVCRKILEHYRQGHSCLALFTQKEHINTYYRYLKLYVPQEQIVLYYGDSKEKSSDVIERLEKREALITLATLAKTTEGTNVKAWEVEFLISSMNDKKNVEQATGRVRRRAEGKIDPVIVYDVRYADCYSLAGHYKNRKEVYDALGYQVLDPRPPMNVTRKTGGIFSRGYR